MVAINHSVEFSRIKKVQHSAGVRTRTLVERRTIARWRTTDGRCRQLAAYDRSETNGSSQALYSWQADVDLKSL